MQYSIRPVSRWWFIRLLYPWEHPLFCYRRWSGKGIPASLLMASTISLLRTLSSGSNSPSQIAYSLNNSIAERNEADMFVTFFIGMLDLRTGVMKYCNAGHTPPVLTSPDRTVAFFEMQSDLPLGILKNHDYQESPTDSWAARVYYYIPTALRMQKMKRTNFIPGNVFWR